MTMTGKPALYEGHHTFDPGAWQPVDLSSERVGRLGSADVGAILGLNPYRSALEVWQTVRGEYSKDLSTVLRVNIGCELEALGLAEYERSTGGTVERVGTIKCPGKPYLSATPDGYDRDAGTVVEVKVTWAGWAEPPAYYWAQVRWQALMLTLSGESVGGLCIVVLRLGGFAPVVEYHRRPYTDNAEDFETVSDWWDAYIETETPPPAAAESLADGSLSRRYPEPGPQAVVEADPAGAELLRIYQVWRERREYSETQEAEAKARICDVIGASDCRGLRAADVGRATWGRRKGSVRTDWQAVAKTAGATDDQIDQHTRVTAGGRTFRWTKSKPQKGEE